MGVRDRGVLLGDVIFLTRALKAERRVQLLDASRGQCLSLPCGECMIVRLGLLGYLMCILTVNLAFKILNTNGGNETGKSVFNRNKSEKIVVYFKFIKLYYSDKYM